MDPFYYLCFVSYCTVCSLQPCGHLLGKDCHLGSLVCDVFLCLCHFPILWLGQVWYWIVWIPGLCLLPYFNGHDFSQMLYGQVLVCD